MKILHVLDTSLPLISGYATRAHYIIRNQKNEGHEPVVITSPKQMSGDDVERIDSVRYYRTAFDKKIIHYPLPLMEEMRIVSSVSKKIIEVIEKEKIDIIHVHSPSLLGLAALKARGGLKIKIIYEIRAFWEDAAVASSKYSKTSLKYKIVRLLETYLCKKVDGVVTISEGMKHDLIKRGIRREKISIVPNGVDFSNFSIQNKNVDLLQRLNLTNKFIFGYIGTFFSFEGIEDLIEVMYQVGLEHDNVAFVLVGGGERETEIANLIKEKNVPFLLYIGKVPHGAVLSYYSIMDAMVFPRKSERVTELTTPLKPLEAMALEKPVICSAVGGLVELVGQENGLFFPPGDMCALKACCVQFLNNGKLREDLAKKGRAYVELDRQWPDIVKKYKSVYGL